MSRHVAYKLSRDADGTVQELAYDTDDVAKISVSTGLCQEGRGPVPAEEREAVITVTFKPGRGPFWQAESEQQPGGALDAELLRQAAEALWNCTKAALTVQPNLTAPYPDDPHWSPWTRWMERRAREAHDLAVKIRKHLAETGRREP